MDFLGGVAVRCSIANPFNGTCVPRCELLLIWTARKHSSCWLGSLSCQPSDMTTSKCFMFVRENEKETERRCVQTTTKIDWASGKLSRIVFV